ncbi:group 1 truncated hemoglobin [Nocardia yunnanensis]|uniref:Group 1 truncated hemoglobin n=1 Tax=Nocardia yunnanensis TaxID=2382165 RepID=A0A386ZDT4_9NOCA|nr:group 1 truncated hemoglobin [Nocardia yunnanensis]AYF75343.1 group 1 truncated hemoglobin [Nocardia yunnanensis]
MPSIYDRLGGAPALTAVVDDFYRRVYADPEVAGFFAGADPDRLERRQVEYFSTVLGGPAGYRGASLRRVHQGMGITRRHFDRVLRHLTAALTTVGVPQELVDHIIEALDPLADDIVAPRPPRARSRRGGSRIWVWSSALRG